MLNLFVFSLFNGLSLGMTVFLVAAGLTLIYGVLKIINFAHGSFFLIGVYVAYSMIGASPTVSGLLLAGAVAGMTTAVLGLAVNRIIFRRLAGTDAIYSVIATFGLMLICNGVVKLVWGLDFHSVNPPSQIADAFRLGPIIVSKISLFTIALGFLVFLGLEFGFHRIWLGKIISAVAHDRWMAAIVGINVRWYAGIAVAIAFFLAGWAGGVLLPNQAIHPGLADNYLLAAFVVVIIGGLGNVRGAFLACLILGFADSLNALFFGDYPGFGIQLAMVVCLLWRPLGIVSADQDREVDDGHSSTLTAAPLNVARPVWLAVGFLLVTIVLAVPLFANPGLVFIVGLVLIQIVFALAWNLLFGYTGLVSFGHAAFFTLGAYFVGYGLKHWSLPFLFLLLLAIMAGAIFSLLVGIIAIRRTNGVSFAIITLVTAQLTTLVIESMRAVGRDEGMPGIPRPVIELGFVKINLTGISEYYWFLCAMTLIICCLLWVIAHNSFSRVLRAIRQDANKAAFLGINVPRYKLLAFVVSASIATLAGGLLAPWAQIVSPSLGTYMTSAQPLFASLLAGAQYFWGPALGTVLFMALDYFARSVVGLSDLITGVSILVVVLVAPTGIVGNLAEWFPLISRSAGKRSTMVKGSPIMSSQPEQAS